MGMPAPELTTGSRSPVDGRASAFGRVQHGLVSRAQLAQVEVGARTIHRRLVTGAWCEPDRGLIDLRTHTPSWQQRLWRALLLAAPDGPAADGRSATAVASHLTAAYLHGMLDVAAPAAIELTVPRECRRPRLRGVSLHRVRHLDGTEVARIGAVPATSVARTLLDLATVLPEDRLQLIAWDAARRRRALPAELAATLAAHAGRVGTRQLRRLVDGLRPDLAAAESPLEVLGLLRLGQLGLAPPVLQHVVRDREGRFVARVDAAWPELKVAVEIDGASHHGTPAARARDAARLARLRELGWTVVVLRHADLRDPAASEAIAHLRRAVTCRLTSAR